MKRNKITLAAMSGLVGLSVLAGSLAYAGSGSESGSAAELQQFLSANPKVATVVADVEAKTGGKVVEAEFDDETAGNGVVEFEIKMQDGSEQEVKYNLADSSMTVTTDEDGDKHESDHEDNDGENEADKD